MRKPVATAVMQFLLAGLAAVILITAASVWVVRRNASSEAVRDAREVAAIDGHAIVEPVLGDDVLAGDPAARTRLDDIVRQRILTERAVRALGETPVPARPAGFGVLGPDARCRRLPQLQPASR